MAQLNLSGPRAFFNQADFLNSQRQVLSQSKPPKPLVEYTTNQQPQSLISKILDAIGTPGRLFHSYMGSLAYVPTASKEGHRNIYRMDANQVRQYLSPVNGEWKIKRIAVKVDDLVIDACILGKSSTLGNGRWGLYSSGNAMSYEMNLLTTERRIGQGGHTSLLEKTNSNMIYFNYPQVGSSSGPISRDAMVKAYKAMLDFLVDTENGIGAKEVIGLGESIGGGVQGEALEDYGLKDDVKYVFVKQATFSDLSEAAKGMLKKVHHILGMIAKFFTKLIGWNLRTYKSSQDQKYEEIILQKTGVGRYHVIEKRKDSLHLIKGDGVISAEASLAYKLLQDAHKLHDKQTLIGIPDNHCQGLRDWTLVADTINVKLAS